MVCCHNDSQPSNFIVGNDKVYLTDFEFAANNDPVYDIACYGGDDIELIEPLLKEYFGQVDEKLIERAHLWKLFQSLQWYNVALHKEYLGLSKELNIDFEKVALYFLNNAKMAFERLN